MSHHLRRSCPPYLVLSQNDNNSCSNSLPSSMDDVWGNAWAQPEQDVTHSLPTKSTVDDLPAWSFSSGSPVKEEEADVGLPSWSTGELNWTEPTGQSSLWSSTSVTDDLALRTGNWGTSEGLDSRPQTPHLQRGNIIEETDSDTPPAHASETEDFPDEVSENEEGGSTAATSDPTEAENSMVDLADDDTTGRKSMSPPPVASSGFEDSEGRGTYALFENGRASVSNSLDESKITWASPVAAFDDENGEADAWGSAWKPPDLAKTDDEEQKDEWTIAREEKARRDRTVPPELLATILEQLNDLSTELWTDEDKPQFDRSLGNWMDGMTNAVGLEEITQRFLPETPGQPPIQFSRSHTAKAMGKDLKLSKNLPIVRNSPMSHLFMAKSLAAWELAVKNKADVHKDDIPAGWRAVEPEKKEDAVSTPVGKKSGGFFSLFGKRASATPSPVPPVGDVDSKRSSLSREAPSETASTPTPTRSSIDAPSLANRVQQSSSVSSFSSVLPVISPTAASPSTKTGLSPPVPSSSQAQQSASEPASQPTPSAVSRFLNRFSRSRSDTRSSSSSPRSSIALSTDDIAFLSDIVPSHSDGVDEGQQLQSLAALVSSPALPARLPPPLAPPPLVPPPRPTPSGSRSHTPQPLVQSQSLFPSPLVPDGTRSIDSLDGLKNLSSPSSFSKPSGGTVGAGIPPPILPLPLPPPLSPTSVASLSNPPTPSPLSGGAPRVIHSRTSSFRSLTASPTLPKAGSPPPVELPSNSSSPVNSSVVSAGSPPVMTPAGGSQGQLQANLPTLSDSPVPPPPIEKSPNRDFAPSCPKPVGNNDEFSEFQSHETLSAPPPRPRKTMVTSLFDTSFGTLQTTVSLPTTGPPQGDPFGNFNNFMSDPSSTTQVSSFPSPPTSPISPPIGVPPPLPKKQPPANIHTLHIRKPSTADHDATSRLLQRAAARPGRWPAPPSPIPNALPPPPSSSSNSRGSTSNKALLELDDDRVICAPATPVRSIALKPIAELPSSSLTPSKAVSPPPLLPPPGSGPRLRSPPEASLLDFGGLTQPVQLKPQTNLVPPASSSGSTGSVLSAQDLSFFDSL